MVELATPPRTQALTSKGFIPPPLDGSLDLQQIFDWHLMHNPSHHLFTYTGAKTGTATFISWGQAVRAAYRGVTLVRKEVAWIPGLKTAPVVAILASSGCVSDALTDNRLLRFI
jgi:hypothetical protein